jgi:hypothetical protein
MWATASQQPEGMHPLDAVNLNKSGFSVSEKLNPPRVQSQQALRKGLSIPCMLQMLRRTRTVQRGLQPRQRRKRRERQATTR